MSAIGRLTAALASATSEVTVAAANINFDFTLVKCEAPKEYQPLGAMLTSTRKINAEAGTTHVTARRLGALFEGFCPPTPSLLKAYGSRVSEISAAAKRANLQDYTESAFSAYTGIDGTSIWAAATSSKAALHIHLLACMIARMFEAPEAVSIWVELTKERRDNITTRFESGEGQPFPLLAAAAQSLITKSDLAEWDASARAWLRTADEIKKNEHTQLQSLLSNITLDVSQDTEVFSSVTEAWKSALGTMENLLSGRPQAVRHGPVLLGLSSWHLYPNIAVFGSENFEVIMNDNLVDAAGVLSLGLSPSRRPGESGVFWCLSLAHLRHYGKPVRTERSIQDGSTRLTFPHFLLAALGAVMSRWQISSKNTVSGMRFFLAICTAFENESRVKWASVISRTASAYIAAEDDELETANRLIQFGRRRAEKFIKEEKEYTKRSSHFHLTKADYLLGCIKTMEMQITVLRHIMSNVVTEGGFKNGDFIIRYNISCAKHQGSGLLQQSRSHKNEYTQKDHRPTSAGSLVSSVDNNDGKDAYTFKLADTDTEDEDDGADDRPFCYATVSPGWSSSFSRISRDDTSVSNSEPTRSSQHYRLLPLEVSDRDLPQDEHCYRLLDSSFKVASAFADEYSYYCGDSSTVAVFSKHSVQKRFRGLSAEDFLWCYDSGYLSDAKLVEHITRQSSQTIRIFQALATAASIYKHLPDATIAAQTLERPLLLSKWYHENSVPNSKIQRRRFKRSLALAIVAYFDSGYCDLGSLDMDNVIAVSSGNSIYVPRQLLCDPLERPKPRQLKRLLGNFGKPGVVLLVPTQEPMMRELDYRKIMSMTTPEFDGKQTDSFRRTSLHLSFTDHHVPVYDKNVKVGKDSQVSVIESFISVRDSGVWVADINILEAINSDYVVRLSSQSPCNHSNHLDTGSEVWSVDTWDDVLDCPADRFVVRAHGNWLARLAVTSVLAQVLTSKGHGKIMICQPDTCWRCLWDGEELDESLLQGFIY